MHIAVTIDTEEDNWGEYSKKSYDVENIKRIPALQKLFAEFNIKPTYLITYPVATNRESVPILRDILQNGNCEIGMHCHPWSTPPFEEERNEYNSMLCNLPYDLQKKKLGRLHMAIENNIGAKATSFRAGRWGYSGTVSAAIRELGYNVDTSITPFTDWSEYHGPDFSRMMPETYRFNAPDIYKRVNKGELLEVPATIGYLQGNYSACAAVDRCLTTKTGKKLRLKGVLSRIGFLNKVWLSPETSDTRQMVQLTKMFMKNRNTIVNLFFHSTSLMSGLSYTVKTEFDQVRFMNRLREYFSFVRETGIRPIALSEAINIL